MKNGDLILLSGRILEMRGRDTVRISEVKWHADDGTVRMAEFVSMIASATMQLMRRLILVVGGSFRSLMLVVTLLVSVVGVSSDFGVASLSYCYFESCG